MTSFTIGADPEFFILNKKNFISAEDKNGPIIPGTKEKPFNVKTGSIQVDGVACEFNVIPSSDEDTFFNSVKDTALNIQKRLHKVNPDFQMAAVSCANFEEEYFKKLPDHVKKLGCMPDMNAYTKQWNPSPKAPDGFRTAGGHICFGWTNNKTDTDKAHFEDCVFVIREAEKWIGPLLSVWEGKTKRSQLYGAPGAFRVKPYGVEWRSPSNIWLKKEFYVRTIYNLSMNLLHSLDSGKHNLKREYPYTNEKQILEGGPYVL